MLSVAPPREPVLVLVPGNVEAEKKVEANEMLQALSLLQRIMTPEDFVKYQVLGGS